MSRFQKVKTIIWSYKIAWQIDKKMLICWYCISAMFSALPAIMISFQRDVLSQLSDFVMYGTGSFNDAVPSIVMLGIFLTLLGLSNRLNSELIYMMMYDKYYIGMEELLMDNIQKVRVQDLLKSEINDKYKFVVGRAGCLTDIISSLCAVFGKLVSIISLLIVAFSSSKSVFYLSSIYVVFIFIISFKISSVAIKSIYKLRKEMRISDYWETMPHGKSTAKEIRIFNNEKQVVSHWEDAYKKVEQNEKRRVKSEEMMSFISSISYYLFLVIIIVISIFNVANGTTTVDVFLIIFALCNNIYKVFEGFGWTIGGFTHGLFALEKQRDFFSIIDKYKNNTDGTTDVKGNLGDNVYCANNLSFSYRDNEQVINNVDFTIKKGDVIALVGKNGSGKTTLIKLLLGLFSPQKGEIIFENNDITKLSADYINSKIGVFFQDYYLFHHSLYENIAYGDIDNFDDIEKVKDAIEKGGADKILLKMPNGFETLIGRSIDKNGVELSGGEKQRIAVARAHMSNKDILIFDEPAAMLDPIAEMEQFHNIQSKLEGRTAILISHRVGFARLANKIIMMDCGEIIETGSHEELMSMQGAYYRFFNEQAMWYNTDSNG